MQSLSKLELDREKKIDAVIDWWYKVDLFVWSTLVDKLPSILNIQLKTLQRMPPKVSARYRSANYQINAALIN